MTTFALVTVTFLVFVSTASAQEASWLVGTWRGETPPGPGAAAGMDQREVVFKPDGTFTSDVQSVRGGSVTHAGKCTVMGETAKCTGTVKTGPRVVLGTSVEYELARKGDDLEGTITSGEPRRTRPVTLRKAK